MTLNKKYQEVPVQEATRIMKKYGKNIVVIVSVDIDNGYGHVTTAGDSDQNGILAKKLGEILGEASGFNLSKKFVYQDNVKKP